MTETDRTWLSKPGLWQQHLVAGEAPELALCGAGYMGYAAAGMYRHTDRWTPWETHELKRRCDLCASMTEAGGTGVVEGEVLDPDDLLLPTEAQREAYRWAKAQVGKPYVRWTPGPPRGPATVSPGPGILTVD